MSIESGKQYSISEIFSGDKRIIIPDLQRDYCWGNRKDLAKNFLRSLIELYEGSDGLYKQVSLGLIYAYENPRNFVNIADGQQRITTIFLLLCVIFRLISKNDNVNEEAKKNIEEFIRLGSNKSVNKTVWEPRLRYEVRESTVYFIKAFINNEISKKTSYTLNKETIKNASWFRDDYKTDPSILSMLDTIDSFYHILKVESGKFELNDFAYFILGITPTVIKNNLVSTITSENNNITDSAAKFPNDLNSISRLYQGYSGICFVYFDVENRDFGEKMYVIINTRGAPMESNEHLKPLLISKLDHKCKKVNNSDECNCQNCWTEKWGKWQDFFWQHRMENEESGDNGFNDFLDWVLQIWLKKEKSWGKEKTRSIANIFSDILNKKEKSLDFIDIDKSENDIALLLVEEIEKYFQALEKLIISIEKEENFRNIINQINTKVQDENGIQIRNFTIIQQQNIIIPMLAFMVKFNNKKDIYELLRRLRKNHFDHERPERNRNYLSLKHILDIIQESSNLKEILSFDSKKTNVCWYNIEEIIKDRFKEHHKEEIECWEDKEHFYGDLSSLIHMSLVCNNIINLTFESRKFIDLDLIDDETINFSSLEKCYLIYNTLETNDFIKKEDHIYLYNFYDLVKLQFTRTGVWKGVWGFFKNESYFYCRSFINDRVSKNEVYKYPTQYQNWFYLLCYEVYKTTTFDLCKSLEEILQNNINNSLYGLVSNYFDDICCDFENKDNDLDLYKVYKAVFDKYKNEQQFYKAIIFLKFYEKTKQKKLINLNHMQELLLKVPNEIIELSLNEQINRIKLYKKKYGERVYKTTWEI